MRSGDPTLLRFVEHGHVVSALPMNVVADRDDLVALWMPGDQTVKWPHIDGRHIREASLEERFTSEWRAGDHHWRGHGLLMLWLPHDAHGTWLYWKGDELGERRFVGWYVNLEQPYRRTQLGFDSRDHTLDLWVDADRTWRWKDEDELDAAVEHGWYSSEEVSAIRAEGLRVVERIERWDSPFRDGWEDWRPDPSWPAPTLPEGWEVV